MEFSPSSSGIEKNNPKKPIPEEVFRAVRVMGQGGGQVSAAQMPERSSGVKNPSRPSPFLDGAPSASPARPMNTAAPLTKKNEASPQQSIFSRYGLKREYFLMAIGGIVILLFLLGIWYWYASRKSPVETLENPSEEESPSVMMQPSVELSVNTPFSPETTNFLSFDTETITPEGLRQLLSEAGEKIVGANMTVPIEFFLTDKNNNPVAFSRFSYLMALGLPEELVSAVGENFSVFLYNDQGKVALGLAFVPEDMAAVQSIVKEQESDLPFLFRSLLFSGVSVPKKSLFRSGTYNNETVRYVNINEAENMSFDYVFKEKEWIIGGSKNTLRAILDKKMK